MILIFETVNSHVLLWQYTSSVVQFLELVFLRSASNLVNLWYRIQAVSYFKVLLLKYEDPISTKKKYKKSELGLSKDIFCISLYASSCTWFQPPIVFPLRERSHHFRKIHLGSSDRRPKFRYKRKIYVVNTYPKLGGRQKG